MARLVSLGLAVLPAAAYGIPKYELHPRQAISNSSFAPSTTSSTQTATVGSSSGAATITTVPLPTVSTGSNGTCPTFYPQDFPDHPFATFTEACQSVQSRELYDKFYYLTNTCLISYCEAQWDSTWESIGSASSTVWTTATRTWFSGAFGTGSLSTVVVTQQYWTSTYTYPAEAADLVTLGAPCCGQCSFADPTIQLYFWPTASADPTPSITGLPSNATAIVTGLPNAEGTYIDDSGFTFTSPSIYLGFTSLAAHDWCGPRGTEIYNTTIAFDPTEISTMFTQETRAMCTITGTSRDGSPYTTTALDLTIPPPAPLTVSDVAQDCSTIEGYRWFANNPSNAGGDAAGDPCHPVIALPTKIQQLQSAWSDCLPVYGGFYDPPKTLKKATALVPSTVSAEPTSEPEPSQAEPSSSGQPEPTQDAPTSQQPEPTRADPTSPQNPSPSEPQIPNASDPSVPSVQPTVQPEDPAPTEEPTPGNSQIPAPSSPPEPTPSVPTPDDPQEPSAQPQPSQDAPQQPSDPGQGSSTTIVITPPPANPSPPSTPGASAPVITLGPGPSVSDSSPDNTVPGSSNANAPNPNPSPSNVSPQNPNSPSEPGSQVITLQPTVLPPTNTDTPDAENTVIIIGTQTLSPGNTITVGASTSTLPDGQTTAVGGTQLVLDPQGTQVVVGGTSTVNLPAAVTPQPTPVVTIADEVITPVPSGPIIVDGQTLQPGSSIVVDDTTVSLAPGGTQIVVDGSTVALPGSAVIAQTQGAGAVPVVVTVGSTTLTADSLTQFTIGEQTLTGGGTVTEDGTTYVLTTNAEGSTILVAGTAGASSAATITETAKSSSENSSKASGSASRTAEESGQASESGPDAPLNTGAAVRLGRRRDTMLLAVGGLVAMMMM